MSNLSAGRLLSAILLAGSLTAANAAAAQDRAVQGLERAFGAAFELAPAVAKHSAGFCQHHARQTSRITRLRDLRVGKDEALALLKVPETSPPTEVDQRIASALSIIHLAVVDFVYGQNLPPADLAAAFVNSACLIEAGKVIGRTRI